MEGSPSLLVAAPPLANNSLALDRVDDIMDYEVEHIFYDRSSRIEHCNSLEYFFQLYPGKDIEYGRRRARFHMAELITLVCCRPAYGGDEQDLTEAEREKYKSLMNYQREEWEDLEADMVKLRTILLRRDATVNYSEKSDIPLNAQEMHMGRAKLSAFNKKFKTIQELIRAHKAIAPIRRKLEDLIDSGVPNFTKRIGEERLQEILDYVDDLDPEDELIQSTVLQLFKGEGKRGPVLVDDKQLTKIVRGKPFNLQKIFQEKFERLVQDMYFTVFPHDKSELMKVRYRVEPDSALDKSLQTPARDRRHVQGLRGQRLALREKHGEDPLIEALELAREAGSKVQTRSGAGSSKPRDLEPEDDDGMAAASSPNSTESRDHRPDAPGMNAKRKSTSPTRALSKGGKPKRRLEIEDSDEDDGKESYSPARARLKPAPRPPSSPKKAAFTSKKLFNGNFPPDEGLFNQDGKKLKRIPWSDEEKESVRMGVVYHGIGDWAEIKESFEQILRNRTNVQIKDCWRTMVRKGEVIESEYKMAPKKQRRRSAKQEEAGDEESAQETPVKTVKKKRKQRPDPVDDKSDRGNDEDTAATNEQQEDEEERDDGDGREVVEENATTPPRAKKKKSNDEKDDGGDEDIRVTRSQAKKKRNPGSPEGGAPSGEESEEEDEEEEEKVEKRRNSRSKRSKRRPVIDDDSDATAETDIIE